MSKAMYDKAKERGYDLEDWNGEGYYYPMSEKAQREKDDEAAQMIQIPTAAGRLNGSGTPIQVSGWSPSNQR